MRERHSKHPAQRNGSDGTRVTRVYKPKARSRITNGAGLLPNVDGRTFWVRRFRDLNALFVNNHLGGSDIATEAEKAIVRRSACMIVELERMEMLFAQAGEATPAQLALYSTTSNTLRRLLRDLGLQRRQKDITPTLGDILRQDQELQRQRRAREWEERQQEGGPHAD